MLVKNVLFKNMRFHDHLLNCPYFLKNIMIKIMGLYFFCSLFHRYGPYCKIANWFRLMKNGLVHIVDPIVKSLK